MANIFAAITAVILAASAYVAYKNQEAFKQEVSNSETEKSRLDTSRKRLAELRSERDATIDERTGVEEDTVAKQKIEEERKAGNDQLSSDIASKRSEVESNAEKIAEIEDQTKEQGELRELAAKVRRLNSEIAGLEDEKAAGEAKRANLLSVLDGTDSSIENYRSQNESFSKQRSFFDSARISSIYGPWGFVTLNAGNTAGVVTGSTLDVVRGGETVAQLRVRSVESSRASADIVPDSVSEDITLMVGDRVVPSSVVEAAPAEEEAAPAEAPAAEEPEAAEEAAPAEEADDAFDF